MAQKLQVAPAAWPAPRSIPVPAAPVISGHRMRTAGEH